MFKQTLAVFICLSLISACAPPPRVAVEERSVLTLRQESERIGGQLIRIVQPGDTLHGIAFAANLNPNKVAAWNNIADTSKLRIGERIRLTEPIGFVDKPKPQRAPKRVPKVASAETKPDSKPTARTPANKKPAVSKPSVSKPSVSTAAQTSTKKRAVVADAWRWPLNGSVIRGFSPANNQQGIDIKSTVGQSVKAARSGEVVYVGNSLRGYGNLIIVKHDETFLSAYAHNQTIVVKEGQNIARHQVVGTVGSNDKKESALHFQIRNQGRPVNPLKYLPEK